jgi:antitoxin component YwqK of YwqJK toxin-antitoxin module
MKTFLLSSLLLLYGTAAMACCSAEKYSLTELLANVNETGRRTIFSASVEQTVVHRSSYMSYATIEHIYRGEGLNKKVRIFTGGFSSAGGYAIPPGAKVLIFSGTRDGKDFGAFVCDAFSIVLPEDSNDSNRRSKAYLDIIERYFAMQESAYTGPVSFTLFGKMLAEGQMLKGQPHGQWKHYHPVSYYDDEAQATVRSIIEYKEGKLHGDAVRYFPTYRYGSRFSTQIEKEECWEDGRLLSSAGYRYDNDTESIYFSGTTRYTYLDDDFHLEHSRYFNPAQQLIQNSTYLARDYRYSGWFAPRRAYHGRYEEYYPDGTPKLSGHYYRGAKVGTWQQYDESGQLVSEENFNHPDSNRQLFQFYYPNGQAMIEGKWANGKAEGKWMQYSAAGEVLKEAYLVNGQLHGTYKHYSAHKKYYLYKIEQYEKGEKHGREESFHPNGKLSAYMNYERGRSIGPAEYFFEDGSLRHRQHFKEGLLHAEEIMYSSPGVLKYKKQYDKGTQVGLSEEYYPNGQLRSTGHYQFGQKTGLWKGYYDNGVLASECHYLFNEGVPAYKAARSHGSGRCTYYDKEGNKRNGR